jgi:hypothetical protein
MAFSEENPIGMTSSKLRNSVKIFELWHDLAF